MYQRLKNYRAIESQIERIEREYPELKEDGEIADNRLREEYKRLVVEKIKLDNVLYSIQDERVRAIAIRHFKFGDSYDKIAGEYVYYSKSRCRNKVIEYFENQSKKNE